MAGSDAAKLSKVLGAAFQMALKVAYPGGSQLERHTVAAYLANGFGQTLGAEIEEQAIEVADLTRKGLTWQINHLQARPIKPILALDAKTNEFQSEPCFLGQGITVKAQFTNFTAECQCLSAESVHLMVKRRIGGRSTCCHGNTFF